MSLETAKTFDFEGLYNRIKSKGRVISTAYGEFAQLLPSDADDIPQEFKRESGELMSFGAGYATRFHDGQFRRRSYVFISPDTDLELLIPKLVYHDAEVRTGDQERASKAAFKAAASIGDEVLKKFSHDWINNNIKAIVTAAPGQTEFLRGLPPLTRQILQERQII